MRFRRGLLALGLLVAAALPGCGGAGLSGEKPNATDAAFVRAMIVHTRAVGEMARIGSRDVSRVELRRLAERSLAGRDQELRELNRIAGDLQTSGVSPAGGGIGESPPYDPRKLRNAVSSDHEFMTRMIAQLEYAMAAASVERRRGSDDMLRLRAAVVYEQSRRDLEALRRWLATWYGEDIQPPAQPAPAPGSPAPGPGGTGPEV